ncbi:hypothetical protein ACFT0D_29220, partial [Streptomyces sp. NPDC056982]
RSTSSAVLLCSRWHSTRRLLCGSCLGWDSGATTGVVSSADLTTLGLPRQHDTLLDGVGYLAGTSQQRLVKELADRIEGLEAAIAFLQEQAVRWDGREWFVVAASSFYIQNLQPLEDAELHQILGLPRPRRPGSCATRTWTVNPQGVNVSIHTRSALNTPPIQGRCPIHGLLQHPLGLG